MILSRLDLEAIAAAITKDFFQTYYGDEVENPNRFVLVTPMNALAKDYLRLRVSYAPLSPDGSIFGLTSYSDTSYTIRIDQQPYAIQLKRNQVILDMSFRNCEKNSGLFRRRRFTLAHECAHQIGILRKQNADSIGNRRANFGNQPPQTARRGRERYIFEFCCRHAGQT